MSLWLRRGLVVCALLGAPVYLGAGAPARAADAVAQARLLEGVRHFRAERYDEALQVFRQIEGAGQAPEIGFYLGMTLHKLGRHLEALVAFRAAHRAGLFEPVAGYYQAVSCFRLGMNQRAHHGFAALLTATEAQGDARPAVGPRLRMGAGRFLAVLDAGGGGTPDALLVRHEAALQQAEAALARPGIGASEALEWLDEAALLLAQAGQPRASQERLLSVAQRLSGRGLAGADVQALLCRVEGRACPPR